MPEMTVMINNQSYKISFEAGDTLLHLLQRHGIPIQAPCAGNGTCGKCLVSMEKNGIKETVQACRTCVQEDARIEIPEAALIPRTAGQSNASTASVSGSRYGAAVDLGTTTIAAALVSLDSGEVLKIQKEWNHQISFGSDVISRLKYILDHEDGLQTLSNMIQGQIRAMIRGLCASVSISPDVIEEIVISGNTIMQHIFAGIDPSSLACAPYRPQTLFHEGESFLFQRFGDCRIRFLPCISAFIGGDITAGFVSSGLSEREGMFLFLDIGTNGEMAIGGKDGFLTCSTASGPAFEGAQISCGMSGNPGAVSHIIRDDSDSIRLSVIGDTMPVGICGSGLVDLLALLLDTGIMDRSGRLLSASEIRKNLPRQVLFRMRHAFGHRFIDNDAQGNGIFYLKYPRLSICQADIRNLQTAKSAIAAGIRMLLSAAGVSTDDLDGFYIAGGFGERLNAENAVRIGLFPPELTGKITCIGNSSLSGAIRLLLHPEEQKKASLIAKRCRYIELADQPLFREEFIRRMNFPV